MGAIKDYRDLETWQVAMEAVTTTYCLTGRFPKSEVYGLSAQMRRCAVSVPSNVAEGNARGGRAGLNHLGIALGSYAELDTQLEVAVRLTYITREIAGELQGFIERGRRLLHGLRRAKRQQLGLAIVGKVTLVLGMVGLMSW
jgi:four helix bundle protein